VTRYLTLFAACAVLLALLACKQSKHERADDKATASASPAAKAPAPAPSVPATTTASAAPNTPDGLFADKLPDGLPPVDRSPVPVETLKKAAKLEDDATKARKAKNYDQAVQLYIESLKADPGYPAGRYNLARTLVLAGKVESGLAVLDQLYRTQDCYRCEGLLLRAAQEKDFASARSRPEFAERTQGIGKQLPTVLHAAKLVIPWLHAPSLNNMPPLVTTRTQIVLQTPKGYEQFRGAGAFIEYVVTDGRKNFPKGRKWGPDIGPPSGMSVECKDNCCDISTYDPPQGRSILRQICFLTDGNAATALSKIKVD